MATALRINASSGPPGSPEQPNTNSPQGINPSVQSEKYIHVHHYVDTGRWGTWFNDPTLKRGSGKRRLYFGTYETEYLAARAQDRAALKFRADAVRPITRLNFAESDYELDKDLRDKLTHAQFRRLLMAESRKCYKRAEPSPCWKIFLEEEAAKGNILMDYESRSNRYHRQPRTFGDVLQEIVSKNEAVDTAETIGPVIDPVVTGEEECKVYTANRIKGPIQAATNPPTEDCAALPARRTLHATPVAATPGRHDTRSAERIRKAIAMGAPLVRHYTRSAGLTAPQVRKPIATLVADPPVRHVTRSSSLPAPQVRKAIAPSVADPPVRHDKRSSNLPPPQVPKAIAPPEAVDPPVRHDTRSSNLPAPQVRKAIAPPEAADPPVRHDTRSANLLALQVSKAIAPPAIRHDTRSTSMSARPIPKASPKAAPPVRPDTRSVSLTAPWVRKPTPKAAQPVLHRDTTNPSQSALPVPKVAHEAAPPVSPEQSTCKRVRPAEGEGLSSLLPSQQISLYLYGLAWGRTKARSPRNFNKLSLPTVASTVPNDGDDVHTTVEIPSKRRRIDIDLNREPEPSGAVNPSVDPSEESDATGGMANPEVTSVETLLLLKAGWLNCSRLICKVSSQQPGR